MRWWKSSKQALTRLTHEQTWSIQSQTASYSWSNRGWSHKQIHQSKRDRMVPEGGLLVHHVLHVYCFNQAVPESVNHINESTMQHDHQQFTVLWYKLLGSSHAHIKRPPPCSTVCVDRGKTKVILLMSYFCSCSHKEHNFPQAHVCHQRGYTVWEWTGWTGRCEHSAKRF